MSTKTHKLAVSPRRFVKLNSSQQVPFRVLYPSAMLDSLAAAVSSKELSASDRIGLLADVYALCRANRLGPSDLFKLLEAYKHEDDPVVWSMMEEKLLQINGLLFDSEHGIRQFHRLLHRLVAPSLARLGWSPQAEDGHLTRAYRGTVVKLATVCAQTVNDEDVLNECSTRFAAYCADQSTPQMPAEYRAAVIKSVLASGGDAQFDRVVALYDALTLNVEKKDCLLALGGAPTEALRKRALEWSISGAVKLQDFFYVMSSMHSSSPDGRRATWNFFTRNFARYEAMLKKANATLMGAVIMGSCSRFTSAVMADEVEAFFKAHPLPQNQRKISQCLESIRGSATIAKKLGDLLEADQ